MKITKSQLSIIESESLTFLEKYPFGKVRVPIEIAQKWLLENKYLEIEDKMFYLSIKLIGLEIFEVSRTDGGETSLKV